MMLRFIRTRKSRKKVWGPPTNRSCPSLSAFREFIYCSARGKPSPGVFAIMLVQLLYLIGSHPLRDALLLRILGLADDVSSFQKRCYVCTERKGNEAT
eukprot:scaffold34915_cov180-Amphora_coffeaeformis.AAC.21